MTKAYFKTKQNKTKQSKSGGGGGEDGGRVKEKVEGF